MFRSFTLFAPALLGLALACGAQDEPPTPAAAPPAAVEPAGPSTPADLPRAIALSLAQFVTVDGKPVPGPARMEFIYRQGVLVAIGLLEECVSVLASAVLELPQSVFGLLLLSGRSR